MKDAGVSTCLSFTHEFVLIDLRYEWVAHEKLQRRDVFTRILHHLEDVAFSVRLTSRISLTVRFLSFLPRNTRCRLSWN